MSNSLDLFLSKHNLEYFKRIKMSGDASLKTFERIYTPTKSIILCNIPNGKKSIKKIIAISRFLYEIGLNPPQIYGYDLDSGYFLMEDFGDNTYLKFLAQYKNSELYLYKNALDVLIKMHTKDNIISLGEDIYTKELMLEEIRKFIKYYMPCFKVVTKTEEDLFEEIWDKILCSMLPCYQTLVLRDYHSPNIFYLPDMQKLKKVGIIDIEDAVIGDSAYDVVSLLQDARYNISINNSNALKEYYIEKLSCVGKYNKIAFNRNYHILGLQRSCKILGFVMYMEKYQNNQQYMSLIPLAKKYINMNIAKLDKSNDIKYWLTSTGVID